MPGLLSSLHLFLPPFLLLASSALLQHERERRPSSSLPRKEKGKESDVEEKENGRQGGREGEREGGGKLLQVFEWPSSLIGWLLCRSSPSPPTVVAAPGEESGGPWVGGGGKKEGREENGGICRMQFIHQSSHPSLLPFLPPYRPAAVSFSNCRRSSVISFLCMRRKLCVARCSRSRAA